MNRLISPVVVCVKVQYLRNDNYRNIQKWLENNNHIYIGRKLKGIDKGDKWINPYTVKKYGVEQSLELYRKHVINDLWNHLHELNGMVLGCWCIPHDGLLCHGDVLVELFNTKYNE